uniref:Uncharacterized protein n=1 Tax=Panagrolaimus davidi TaxID=227884 RepID=A0A914PFU7_9BILA
MALRSKQLHFHGPYRQQNWPFKLSFINYITKTPSNAKAWQKLIQSCKYFFAKNPIVVADSLDLHQMFEVSAGRLQKFISSNNISYKLWITEKLRIYGADPKDVSSIIPQIYRCDAKKLLLHGQILSYNEFLFLSRNAEVLFWGVEVTDDNKNFTVVKNEDGTIVPLEKLVKTLVSLKRIMGEIDPSHSCITKGTVKELLEIPHFSKLDEFVFTGLPEVFDIDTFFAYLKKNKYTKFELHFADSISEEYKVLLDKVVDEILQTETHDYIPPIISSNGLAQEKFCKMRYLYDHSFGL